MHRILLLYSSSSMSHVTSSRSFAVVIQQLPEQLKDAVCIFYLVLRGLDSVGMYMMRCGGETMAWGRAISCYRCHVLISTCHPPAEDDMDYPVADKLALLLSFDKKLSQDGWHIAGVGDTPDYRTLLANFEKVIRVFKSLKPQ